jgi:hypothetical protein
MRKIIIGTIIIAGLVRSVPVFAQQGKELTPVQQIEENKKKDRHLIDQQYERTLRSTDQATAPVKIDPWANMRGPSTSDGKK